MTTEEIKYVFEYIKSVDYDYKKVKEIAKKFNLSIGELRKEIIKYYRWWGYTGLKNIPIDVKQAAEDYIILNDYDKDKTDEYLSDHWILDSDLSSDTRFMLEINPKSLDKINPFLLKHGITKKYIYTNEQEKEIIEREFLQLIMENGKKNSIAIISRELGIDNSIVDKLCSNILKNITLEERIKIFDKDGISISEEEKSVYIKKRYQHFIVFDKLIEAKNDDEIINIIESCDYGYHVLASFRVAYLNNKCGSNKEDYTYYNNIIDKNLKIYSNFKTKENKEKQKEKIELNKNQELEERKQYLYSKLPEYKQLIIEFLDYKYLIIHFCDYKKIDREYFNEAMEALSYFDEELHNLCSKTINERQKQQFASLISKLKNLVLYIKNGIEVNGQIRTFDIVDYFTYTKLSFDEIVNLGKQNLNNQEIATLRRFIAQNKAASKNNQVFVNEILISQVVINIKFDDKGKMIPGTGEEVSRETKQKILNYLKIHQIPINNKTYNIVFNRYLTGEILLEENEEIEIKK